MENTCNACCIIICLIPTVRSPLRFISQHCIAHCKNVTGLGKSITHCKIYYTTCTSSHILWDCLAFLSFFWCQKTRTNSRTSTTCCLLWQQFDVHVRGTLAKSEITNTSYVMTASHHNQCIKSKMVWCFLTLQTHLLFQVLSIILDTLISPYLNFGLLSTANITWLI